MTFHSPISRYLCFTFFLILLSGLQARVAIGSMPQVLIPGSLPALLNEAMQNHPTLAVKRSELTAAGYELEAAEWGRWPTFGLNSEALSDGYALSATIEQPLWSGGRISGQIDATQARETLARAALAEAQLDVVLETSSGFFEVIRLEERLLYAKRNEQEHRNLLQMIRRRVAAEISPMSDEVLALSRLQRAITTRVQTEQQLSEALVALERSVGRYVSPRELNAPEYLPLESSSVERLLNAALAYSPERERLKAEVAAAAAEVKVVRAQIWPTVVAGFERTLSRTGGDDLGDEKAYLAVNLQTGAGLSNRATVQAASSRREAARQGLADQERQLRQRIAALLTEVNALESQLGPMKTIVEGSEAMVVSYLNQFQVGKKSWLDVLNGQNEKAQAYFLKTDVEMPLLRAKLHLLVLSGAYRPVAQEVSAP